MAHDSGECSQVARLSCRRENIDPRELGLSVFLTARNPDRFCQVSVLEWDSVNSRNFKVYGPQKRV